MKVTGAAVVYAGGGFVVRLGEPLRHGENFSWEKYTAWCQGPSERMRTFGWRGELLCCAAAMFKVRGTIKTR